MKAVFFSIIFGVSVSFTGSVRAADGSCPTNQPSVVSASCDSNRIDTPDTFTKDPHYVIYYDDAVAQARRNASSKEALVKAGSQQMRLDLGLRSFEVREGPPDVCMDPMDTAANKNLRQELSRRVMITDNIYLSRKEGVGAYLTKDTTISGGVSGSSLKVKLSLSF